jgi:hypothetical protein
VSDDLIQRAKAALEGGDVFNEWLLFHPIARALIDTTAERDALRERVARMRDALEGIAGYDDPYEPCGCDINTARAALQEDTPND